MNRAVSARAAVIVLCASPFFPTIARAQVVIEAAKPFAAKVPAEVQAMPDDSLCTLKWNHFPRANTDREATGFEVRWGKKGDEHSKRAATSFTVYQCQPLEPGVVYSAQVRSVDKFGRASVWTQPVTFSQDSTRVNAIRAQCLVHSGFFDDFNQPQGLFDPLKHNFAVTRFSDEKVNCFLVNSQNHAHLMVSSLRWDRGKVIDRPRAEFDISDGGTRTVFIDMDSPVNGRTTWYLDFIPANAAPYDMSNRISVAAGDGEKADAPGMLRISQSGSKLEIMTADQIGALVRGKSVTLDYPPGGLPKLVAVPNIRRPWKFTVSKNLVEAYVLDWNDGKYKKILSAPVNLTWTRARLFNTAFAYHNRKEGLYAWLWHFDNFGCDAPASAKPTPVVYNYLTQAHNGAEYGAVAESQKTHVIKIPDAVSKWKHTLYFTVSKSDGNSSALRRGAGNVVVVNGRSFPLNVPDDNLRSTKIDLPAGLIHAGATNGVNTLVFQFAGKSGVLNIHIEAERPAGDTGPLPTYTNHCGIWGCDSRMGLPIYPLGPEVSLVKVGQQSVGSWGNYVVWNKRPPIPVSGMVTITGEISQISCVAANGVAAPCDHLDFLIDPNNDGVTKTFSLKQDTAALAGTFAFGLDTTKLSNGRHEIFLRGYTPTNIPSNPYYFNRHTENGDYLPVAINVQN